MPVKFFGSLSQHYLYMLISSNNFRTNQVKNGKRKRSLCRYICNVLFQSLWDAEGTSVYVQAIWFYQKWTNWELENANKTPYWHCSRRSWNASMWNQFDIGNSLITQQKWALRLCRLKKAIQHLAKSKSKHERHVPIWIDNSEVLALFWYFSLEKKRDKRKQNNWAI